MAIDRGTGSGPAARAAELTVGQLASRAGVRADTVRYYERAGLLPRPLRTGGDHRRYGAADVDRLLFIKGAKRLGLRLAEIRDLMTVRETGVCPCDPAEALLRAHLAETDREIARLTALRAQLAGMIDGVAGPSSCPEPVPGTWQPPGARDTGSFTTVRPEAGRPAAKGGADDVLVLR
jgi:DNA-binding transcriptional MerR regulator